MPKLSKPEKIKTKCRVCAVAFTYFRTTKPRSLCDKHQSESEPGYQKRYYVEVLKARRQSARSVRGFFEQLTPEQKKAALEYDGPENLGDLTHKRS